MIQLTEILDQGNKGACASYAFANLATALLHQKGIDDKIDPLKLFNATERNGASSPWQIIEVGQQVGFIGASGKIYKLVTAQPIRQTIPDIQNALYKYGGLVLVFSLHDENFNDRLDSDFNLQRPNDNHAVIIVEDQPDQHRFKCANSWGPNWGDKGYFYIDYPYISGRDFQYFLGISL